MKVVWVYRATKGKPVLIGEKQPLDDSRVTHGICVEHQRRLARTAEEPPLRTPPVCPRASGP